MCDTWERHQEISIVKPWGGKEIFGSLTSCLCCGRYGLWRQHNEVIFRCKKLLPWLVVNRATENAKPWQKFCGKENRTATEVVLSTGAVNVRTDRGYNIMQYCNIRI